MISAVYHKDQTILVLRPSFELAYYRDKVEPKNFKRKFKKSFYLCEYS